MLIDCDTCAMRDIACADCVVTMLLREPSESGDFGSDDDLVDLDDCEREAVHALAAGGLISPLRLVPIADPDHPRRPIRHIA